MKNCLILGDRSDIAIALKPMLEADGWNIIGWNRETLIVPWEKFYLKDGKWICEGINWDVVIVAIGKVSPVGMWYEQDENDWDECVHSNVLKAIRLLRDTWKYRNPGAYVCFLAGSNPNKIMDGYSAYCVGKMALLKAVEQLDHESPDCTMFALGPGVTDTKIHNATKEAGWPNPRLERAIKDGSFTPPEKIYECLKWCLTQTKEVIGGRNICVSDGYGPGLAVRLKNNPDLFKLRRVE